MDNLKCYAQFNSKNQQCNICQYSDYCIDAAIDKRNHHNIQFIEDIHGAPTITEADNANNIIINTAKGIADFYLQLNNPKDIVIALLVSAGFSVRQIEAKTFISHSTIADTIQKLRRNPDFKIVFNHYNKRKN
ncbi:hypothetical protein AAEX28_04240 [Lentisphaerota bacterium WC36G]|nr:hypothetical protein LJT99_07110 [Lentisphaerae bacterium WC36]